jgi:hypothetical protein
MTRWKSAHVQAQDGVCEQVELANGKKYVISEPLAHRWSTSLKATTFLSLPTETVISLGKLQTLHDVDEATDDLRSSEDCSGAAENIDGSGPLVMRSPKKVKCQALR